MKLGIFTTDTLHHAYFVRRLIESFADTVVFQETRQLSAQFSTAHAFEAKRDAYEREQWFNGDSVTLADVCNPHRYETLNAPEAMPDIHAAGLDAALVFGTGKLSKALIKPLANKIINLHGGDPETYRGLDTHLWAIYHNDFAELITTLHTLTERLDDGRIISALPVTVQPNMELHHLRRQNTETCLRLSVEALTNFALTGAFISRPQRTQGRYYSFMPSDLKDICVRNFHNHTKKL